MNETRLLTVGLILTVGLTATAAGLLLAPLDEVRIEPADTGPPPTVFTVTNLPPPLTTEAVVTTHALRGPAIQVAEPPVPTGVWGLPFAPSPLEGCDEMSWYRTQFGLPARFDKIAWRESRCIADPSVRTSCCVGPVQLWVALHLQDRRLQDGYADCGVTSEYDVDGPQPIEVQRHWCATAALYSTMGYSPWSTS